MISDYNIYRYLGGRSESLALIQNIAGPQVSRVKNSNSNRV